MVGALSAALCLAGATGAVALGASTSVTHTVKHHEQGQKPRGARDVGKHECQRRRHRHKRKRCKAVPRRKPASHAHVPGTPIAPGSAPGGGPAGYPSISAPNAPQPGIPTTPPSEVTPVESPPVGVAPNPPGHVQVSAKEFSLTLSRPSTQAGATVVELVNAGQDEHDLHIRPAGGGPDVGAVGIVLPGHHSDVEFHLAPGSYTFYCALPAHEELGMKATFTVQ